MRICTWQRALGKLPSRLALLVVLAGAGGSPAADEVVKIGNPRLSVSWSAATGLSITEVTSGRKFVTTGKLREAAGTARVERAAEKIFGDGPAIQITYEDGGRDEILLAGELPFVLIRSSVHNATKEPITLRQVQTLQARLDLGQPADRLKVLGTGGLQAAADKPGSYMWMTVADPQTRSGVVAGWLSTDRGSGVISAGVAESQVQLNSWLDYGRLRLAPGRTETLETLAIGWFADVRLGLEAWAAAVAKVYQVHLPAQPCGYCTWYHSGASNEKELAKTSAWAAEKLAPFGFSVIQIDDGWQEGDPQGNGPRKNFTAYRAGGPYPGGMKAAADDVLAKGLVPGIWFMPFAGTHNDPWFQTHQDWFVKRADGTPYDTAWGGTSLDMTQPAVQDYLRGIVQRLVHEWGYRYLKMDGLYTGVGVPQIYVNDAYREDRIGDAVFHNPDKTNIEAYRDGLRLVRQTAGRDVFLLGCCANQNMRSYGGAFGLVDAMRIGPDNGAAWQGVLTGPTYGSRNYFLHGRVWYNDPDPIYVRTSLSVEQARVSCSWAGVTGQLTLGSDDFERLPPERIQILQRVLPAHGRQARPVDWLDEPLPRIWLVSDEQHSPRRDVIGLFNWSNATQALDCSLERLGLPVGRKYLVFDFWSAAMRPPLDGALKIALPRQSCAVLAVRALADHPQVLSTSRHVTQGLVDVTEERWDGDARQLTGVSCVVGGDDYELRVATYSSQGLWQPAAAEVSAEDRRAGVTIALAQTAGLVRATIRSPAARQVRWQVGFQAGTKPEVEPVEVRDLRADVAGPFDPVTLAWEGTAPFYEVRRSDAVLSCGQGGRTLTDTAAGPGETYRYCVVPLTFAGRRGPAVEAVVKVPAADLGPVPPLPDVSLMKLKPKSARTGWGEIGSGKSAAGLPLTLGKDVYADGLGLHANAEVVYERQQEWKRFVAVVGPDESRREDPRTSIICEVVSAGRGGKTVLARSPVLKFGRFERWHFDVTLPADCLRLHLIVNDADGSNHSDHTDWVNAGFCVR